jgi:hypothetical protein
VARLSNGSTKIDKGRANGSHERRTTEAPWPADRKATPTNCTPFSVRPLPCRGTRTPRTLQSVVAEPGASAKVVGSTYAAAKRDSERRALVQFWQEFGRKTVAARCTSCSTESRCLTVYASSYNGLGVSLSTPLERWRTSGDGIVQNLCLRAIW